MQINSGRLIEAHFTCLTKNFDRLQDEEPFLAENDRPTEEEIERFEEEERIFRLKARLLVILLFFVPRFSLTTILCSKKAWIISRRGCRIRLVLDDSVTRKWNLFLNDSCFVALHSLSMKTYLHETTSEGVERRSCDCSQSK